MNGDEMLYGDYLTEWLKSKRYSVSNETLRVSDSYIRHQIIPLLGHRTLLELNPMVLQNFVNGLKDKGLASGSVKRIFTIVHSSLDAAEKMQIIPKNYASLVSLPRLRRKQLQVWDVEQVQHFLSLASQTHPWTYVAIHLALLTGMRQGEILGLRWVDVDFEGEVLYVRQTLSHDGKEFLSGAKTSSGIRSIALDSETVSMLRKHKELVQEDKETQQGYEDNDLVVCSRLGHRIYPRVLMTAFYKLLAVSGLPKLTFHDLRHTHASLLLKSNVHPKVVSERLGHSSVQITLDTYSHLLPNMQKDAAGKLGHDIFGSFQPRP